jgi:hypothetical protein
LSRKDRHNEKITQEKKFPNINWQRVERPHMKDVTFYLPKYDATIAKHLEKVPKIASQKKLYSNTIELFPSRQVEPKTGYGYYLINVDGYSYLNCYLISDALFSSNQRGFTLEVSFALEEVLLLMVRQVITSILKNTTIQAI